MYIFSRGVSVPASQRRFALSTSLFYCLYFGRQKFLSFARGIFFFFFFTELLAWVGDEKGNGIPEGNKAEQAYTIPENGSGRR